jgi:hypothetical protein
MDELHKEETDFPDCERFDVYDAWGTGLNLTDEFNPDQDFFFYHG